LDLCGFRRPGRHCAARSDGIVVSHIVL
jgi:hypothetical protein